MLLLLYIALVSMRKERSRVNMMFVGPLLPTIFPKTGGLVWAEDGSNPIDSL